MCPGAWSTGVGSALMGAALDHLRAQGFRQVTLWVLEGNGRGRTFYERWGFTDDGSRHVEEIGAPVTELRYSRALP